MPTPIRRTVPRLARGAIAMLAATVLVLAGATSAASGHEPSPDRDVRVGEAALAAALERDLGLSGAKLDAVVEALSEIDELSAGLRADTGDAYAGSWFDHEAATLVVAVTDPAAARVVRDAGARSTLVRHSERELSGIHDELDALAKTDPDALAGVLSWSADVKANRVVVTVPTGDRAAFASLRAQYGPAVRIEESSAELSTFSHDGPWLDGGVQYVNTSGGWSCSVGFNVRNPNTGARYFLTAGHCGDPPQGTRHGTTNVGPFVESWFPTFDDAIVQVTNTNIAMGPWVWTYPGLITITGSGSAGVGTPICKSGMTTQVTCGVVTAKNVTVNYPQGTVFGLGQHSACAEPGDSGGSTYTPNGIAQGMTSGGQMIGGQCLEKFGMQNISFYQEVTASLSYYGSVYGIQLW
jgi:streptogrisin C